MAHGENANKNWGKEYWSTRLRFASGWGGVFKKLTRSKDRMRDKKIVLSEVREAITNKVD